jgi:hypothetical protein
LLQHLRSLTTWAASTAMKLRQIHRLGMNSAWEILWEAVHCKRSAANLLTSCDGIASDE